MAKHDPHFEAYKIAIATRNFEIDLYWKRSLFFWGFIATAGLGYGALMSADTPRPNLAIVVACFGLICSLCWSLVNRGSKYWQEHWESMVTELEVKANVGELFRAKDTLQHKTCWLNSRKFSVSKTAIALSDFTIFVWIGLILNYLLAFMGDIEYLGSNEKLIIAVALTGIYAIILLLTCKSSSWKSFTTKS
ncbi:hypothetical protein L3V77_24120 [Vibrio sp. DW001]|uniref:RipA family octameric membrane protein n=1 Tax=Vibrio sp. DW001 TaxID=2912315 RepID=UPI0023B1DDE4|nr:hypothetical protein [Vibrio sp. DW001]WED29022.1 hypothetical protein L3V77_24120 [Vibrio sp. DW001]